MVILSLFVIVLILFVVVLSLFVVIVSLFGIVLSLCRFVSLWGCFKSLCVSCESLCGYFGPIHSFFVCLCSCCVPFAAPLTLDDIIKASSKCDSLCLCASGWRMAVYSITSSPTMS